MGILKFKNAIFFFFLKKLFNELNKERLLLLHRGVTYSTGNRVTNSVTTLHGVGYQTYHDDHFIRHVDVE